MSRRTSTRSAGRPVAAVAAHELVADGVDLLPAPARAALELRGLRVRLAAALVGVAVLLVAVFVLLLGGVARARGELDLAGAETTRLQSELDRYAEATQARADIDRVREARSAGMGTEIRWMEQLRRIEAVMPEGTTILSFTAQAAAPGDAMAVATPDALVPAGVGSISFSVRTPALPDTAAWLEALNGIPGFTGASFTSAALVDESRTDVPPGYVVASTVQITSDALSGEYAQPAATSAGTNDEGASS